MPTLPLIKVPAAILRKKQKPLNLAELLSRQIQQLIKDMHKTMIEANGVGLAANQINQDLQLFVINKKLAEENKVPNAFINPEITEYSRETDEMEEGCLSIPAFYAPIRRAKKIKIKALDRQGNKIKFKVRGFLARVLQHETDHTNGLVIKDRV